MVKIKVQFADHSDDGITEFGPSLTKQCFRDESDINNILKRFERTGVLPEMIRQNPQYGDFTDVPSYQESLDIVMKAEEQFLSLDAKLRREFDNDPVKFLEFVNDPSNAKRMVELGLATERVDVSTSDVHRSTSVDTSLDNLESRN